MKHISLLLQAFFAISVLLYVPLAQAGDIPEFTITEGMDFDLVELYDLEYIIDGTPLASIWPPTRVDMTGVTSAMRQMGAAGYTLMKRLPLMFPEEQSITFTQTIQAQQISPAGR